ncbi:MAG: hypothetical protein M1570_06885 [Chloroflexi bacterium]|nr:hypothetical protein [Chloroflexota bacterium]
MTPVEILFSFGQIVFPASLLVPAILAAFPPEKPLGGLAVLFFAPLAELWVTILVAVLILVPPMTIVGWITLATLPIVGVLLTYGLMKIVPLMLEVNLSIKVIRRP